MPLEKKQGDEGVAELEQQWAYADDRAQDFTGCEVEAREQERNMIQEMLKDRKNAAVFREKIQEFESKLRDSQLHLSALGKKYVEASGEEKEWHKWAMERERDRMADHKKNLKRFEMYYQQCIGRVNLEKRMLDVGTAKETPIERFMPHPPDYKTQGSWKYKCPLHTEKSASFVWYRKNNTWYCFGGCGQGGDNIDLYKRLFQTDFVTAVSELLRLA